MSKIGILTFHFADNYGAVLQCLALQEKCKELGCDVEIINYKPYQMITWKSRVKQLVHKSPQQRLFQSFRDNHFIMSTNRSKFDCVVVGSDQVWNPSIIGFDDYWFSPKENYGHICSYAASFGKASFNAEELSFLKKQTGILSQYDTIAVREEAGKSILNKLGIDCVTVCDPTLLFYDQADFYRRLSERSKLRSEKQLQEGYILVYSLEKSEVIDFHSQKIKTDIGLPVVSLHPMNGRTQDCDMFINDTDPYDFLWLIDHSSCVITNSFHGLAFSYIFKKKVFCVGHSSLSSRQTELIRQSDFVFNNSADNVTIVDCNQSSILFQEYIDDSLKILTNITRK